MIAGFLGGIIVGFVAGIFVYRNNAKQLGVLADKVDQVYDKVQENKKK